MSRVAGVLVLLVLLAAGALYAGSPILVFQQLQAAARAGDKDRLEALVDFPAVRENLKKQVDSHVTKLARTASGVGYPVAMILGRIGAALGDKSVDRLVTPESISAMVNLGEARHGRHHHAAEADAGAAKDGPPADAGETGRIVTHYAYLTPDRFRVSVAPASQPDVAVGLIMDRQGLFSWRVQEIELPD